MNPPIQGFDEQSCIEHIRHYLPSQSALKDFVHHNTLHAFQQEQFHQALKKASEIFGYQVYLSIDEYRKQYKEQKINPELLPHIIRQYYPQSSISTWLKKMLEDTYEPYIKEKTGQLRAYWKSSYKLNMDKAVHPLLFRLLGGYLDQGIGINPFPGLQDNFLASIRHLDKTSYLPIFSSVRAQWLLHQEDTTITQLLELLIGDPQYFETYLFDQQFSHPGWSGMVSVIEQNPANLLDERRISLRELVILELLIEINTLDEKFGGTWKPLTINERIPKIDIFEPTADNELFDVLKLWQEAYEWSYYDQVLKGLQIASTQSTQSEKSFQAIFCIDDRECSFRRHLENSDKQCTTFSTPGFFNVPIYFQPQNANFYTKLCPANQEPKHLVREYQSTKQHKKNPYIHKRTHSLLGGWIITQTMGFWAGIKMARSIFFPLQNDAVISALTQMDAESELGLFSEEMPQYEKQLKLGFTITEMADRVENFLKSLGLIEDFYPIIYVVGHGATSVNNTHYAGYDCGACCGRAGSVNARAISMMANHPEVREILRDHHIFIPDSTVFIGAIHDTTRDEMAYFDLNDLSESQRLLHRHHRKTFDEALRKNAKERSRRFDLMSTKGDPKRLHEKVKKRSLSLFEPRPEWNHANNALCLVGRRATNKHLFFDKRAFLNSYDYRLDKDGRILENILRAIAPVCGGINLEYYFSAVDNYRLGAGTKLSHNVMGLIGVANGMEGDLLTGLPRQMVNIHEPKRLMVVVEHEPEFVLKTIRKDDSTYNWFDKAWIHLAVVHPETKQVTIFRNGEFHPYTPVTKDIERVTDLDTLFEQNGDSLNVYTLY